MGAESILPLIAGPAISAIGGAAGGGGQQGASLADIERLTREPAFPEQFQQRIPGLFNILDLLQNLSLQQLGQPGLSGIERQVLGQAAGEAGIPLPPITPFSQEPIRPEVQQLIQQQQQQQEPAVTQQQGFGLLPAQTSAVEQFARQFTTPGAASDPRLQQLSGRIQAGDISSLQGSRIGPSLQALISQGIPLSAISAAVGGEQLGGPPGLEVLGAAAGLQGTVSPEELERRARGQQGGSHTPEHRAQQALAGAPPRPGVAAQPPSQFAPQPTSPRRPGVPVGSGQQTGVLGAIQQQALGRLQAPTGPALPDFGSFLQQRLGDVGRSIEEQAVSRGLSPAGGVAQQLSAEAKQRTARELIPQEAQFGLQRAALGEQFRQADIESLFRGLPAGRAQRGEILGIAGLQRQREQQQLSQAFNQLFGGPQQLAQLFQAFTPGVPGGAFQNIPSPLAEGSGRLGSEVFLSGLERLRQPRTTTVGTFRGGRTE